MVFVHFRQRKCTCQGLDRVNSALSENIRRRGVTLTTTHACLKLRPAGGRGLGTRFVVYDMETTRVAAIDTMVTKDSVVLNFFTDFLLNAFILQKYGFLLAL